MTEINFLQSAEFLKERALSVPAPHVHPAVESTAVFVPTLNRPHHAKPFMESLKSSNSPLATAYAIVDKSDPESAEAWGAEGAELLWFDDTRPVPWVDQDGKTPGTWGERCNLGYRSTDEPWMLLVGDDVRFHPNWDSHAQAAARDGAHVIGTNDLHNELVIFGLTTAHPFIRRNYVDERGASFDGPGVLCHEGYRHNCTDTEIVNLSIWRGVWAFARHAKVEHIHHSWGLAQRDETYSRGDASYGRDYELWKQREKWYGAVGSIPLFPPINADGSIKKEVS